jgi:hypothetical protein
VLVQVTLLSGYVWRPAPLTTTISWLPGPLTVGGAGPVGVPVGGGITLLLAGGTPVGDGGAEIVDSLVGAVAGAEDEVFGPDGTDIPALGGADFCPEDEVHEQLIAVTAISPNAAAGREPTVDMSISWASARGGRPSQSALPSSLRAVTPPSDHGAGMVEPILDGAA